MGYSHVCEDAFRNTACEDIDLSSNNLKYLPANMFSSAFNLLRLNLQGNLFVRAPLIQNAKLEFIDLDENPLNDLPDNYTGGLKNLKVLSLQNCRHLNALGNNTILGRFGGSSLTVRLNGTKLQNLPESCFECVNTAITAWVNPQTVDVQCYKGCAVTLESIKAELLNPQNIEYKPGPGAHPKISTEHPTDIPDSGNISGKVATGIGGIVLQLFIWFLWWFR